MRRIIFVLIFSVLIFSLISACGGDNPTGSDIDEIVEARVAEEKVGQERIGNTRVYDRIDAMTDCTLLQQEFDTAYTNFEARTFFDPLRKISLAYLNYTDDHMRAIGCYGSPTRTLTSTPTPSPTPELSTDLLELQSANCTIKGNWMYDKGEVKNISMWPLEHVQVVTTWYDKNDTYITHDTAHITYNPILPGQISPFENMDRYNPAATHCRRGFITLIGGTIPTRKISTPTPTPTPPPTPTPTPVPEITSKFKIENLGCFVDGSLFYAEASLINVSDDYLVSTHTPSFYFVYSGKNYIQAQPEMLQVGETKEFMFLTFAEPEGNPDTCYAVLLHPVYRGQIKVEGSMELPAPVTATFSGHYQGYANRRFSSPEFSVGTRWCYVGDSETGDFDTGLYIEVLRLDGTVIGGYGQAGINGPFGLCFEESGTFNIVIEGWGDWDIRVYSL